MRFVFYTQSLVSDWNHGNAHFLRGVMRELVRRGHKAAALEPDNGWSRANLMREHGEHALDRFYQEFPELVSLAYSPTFPHEEAVTKADVVVVHEWTEPQIVERIGRARRNGGDFTLLFHDTHHRAVSAAPEIAELRLDGYDCVLAFGESLRERYLEAGWGSQVSTWHEAADISLFRPLPEIEREQDVVWIGNWGDGERSDEISTFLVDPMKACGLGGNVHGVRYPSEVLERLAAAGLRYQGWISNVDVPEAFARHRLTVHIPRAPYASNLPGIPTIRMFEALASGIPLISAPWSDSENLFRVGQDFLMARNGDEMARLMRDVAGDGELAASLAESGLESILSGHTCAHRVDELLAILAAHGSARVQGMVEQREAAE